MNAATLIIIAQSIDLIEHILIGTDFDMLNFLILLQT